ncbi:hypothetical protein WA538_002835, partial [Blastocystis sp. DL]
MSRNCEYNQSYTRKIYDASQVYIKTKELSPFLDLFKVAPESDTERIIISVLDAMSASATFDDCNIDLKTVVSNQYSLRCCICGATNYSTWRLVGSTPQPNSQFLKYILPFLFCEKCFRKRFCYQDPTPFLCGVAVLPPVDYSPDQFQEVGTESHRNPQKESLSCAETVPAEEPLSSSLSSSTESSLPVKSFVVSSRSGPFNSWSVCSIVIEKGILHKTVGKERNEKRESVPLADCIFAHSTLESDKRRPYCVSITSQQSSFSLLLSFENRAQEEEFLNVLQEYH